MNKDGTHNATRCLDVRRSLYFYAGSRPAEILDHLTTCPAFAKAAAEARYLERGLTKLFARIPVPENAAARIMFRQSLLMNEWSRLRRLGMAVAASMLLLFGISGYSVWRMTQQTFTADIVAHILEQPHYPRTAGEPAMSPVDALRVVGAEQVGDLGEVMAASVCDVSSRRVAHLVIEGDTEPAAVLLIPDEAKAGRIELASANTTLVPIRGGMIGIVGVQGAALTALESKPHAGLRWQLL